MKVNGNQIAACFANFGLSIELIGHFRMQLQWKCLKLSHKPGWCLNCGINISVSTSWCESCGEHFLYALNSLTETMEVFNAHPDTAMSKLQNAQINRAVWDKLHFYYSNIVKFWYCRLVYVSFKTLYFNLHLHWFSSPLLTPLGTFSRWNSSFEGLPENNANAFLKCCYGNICTKMSLVSNAKSRTFFQYWFGH